MNAGFMFFCIFGAAAQRTAHIRRNYRQRNYLIMRVKNRSAGFRPPIMKNKNVFQTFIFGKLEISLLKGLENQICRFSVQMGEIFVVVFGNNNIMMPHAFFNEERAAFSFSRANIFFMRNNWKFILNHLNRPVLQIRINHGRISVAGFLRIFKRATFFGNYFTFCFLFKLILALKPFWRYNHPIARDQILSKFGIKIHNN